MTKKTESTEMAQFKGKTTLATRNERVGQGSENVKAEDMAIPRIKLLQSISDEVQPGNPVYLEEAKPGMLIDSVSKKLYTSLYLINLHFSKRIVAWRKRKLGGGMFGQFDSEAEAYAALEEAKQPVENYDIVENPTHLVMLIDEDGNSQGTALLDMPGIKGKVSKNWNTLINDKEKAGHPRFSVVWELSSFADSNSEGNFHQYSVEYVVDAPDEIYALAQAEYDSFFGIKEEEKEAA